MQTMTNPVAVAETGAVESALSAVSWAAIVAGAFATVATSLILVALGSGLGFASVSPWSNANPSAMTFGVLAAVWLIIMQWLSAAIGGYLTGRLRTKWVGVHTDEVYFRDTAHGFLAWALATVVTAALLGSALSSFVGGATKAVASVAGGAAQGASAGAVRSEGTAYDPSGYLVDSLFRSDHPDANANPQAVTGEASRIIASGLRSGDVPEADKAYLTQLVAAHTGLSQADARKRVDDVIAKAKEAKVKALQAADTARKAASYLSFFTAFSMLIGAFIAAVAATVAGHRRDELIERRY